MCLSRPCERRRSPRRCRNHKRLAEARFLRCVRLCVVDAVVKGRPTLIKTGEDQLDRKHREKHNMHQEPDREGECLDVENPETNLRQ